MLVGAGNTYLRAPHKAIEAFRDGCPYVPRTLHADAARLTAGDTALRILQIQYRSTTLAESSSLMYQYILIVPCWLLVEADGICGSQRGGSSFQACRDARNKIVSSITMLTGTRLPTGQVAGKESSAYWCTT
jgi:hypothetical protein